MSRWRVTRRGVGRLEVPLLRLKVLHQSNNSSSLGPRCV
jgi:hypothetical protein